MSLIDINQLGLDRVATLPPSKIDLLEDGFNSTTEVAIQEVCSQSSIFAQSVCDNLLRAQPGSGILAPFFATNLVSTCLGTRYGCCGDGRKGTPRYISQVTRLNPQGFNCSADIKCINSAFGCCNGTDIVLRDQAGTNCPKTLSIFDNDDPNDLLQVLVENTKPDIQSQLNDTINNIGVENIDNFINNFITSQVSKPDPSNGVLEQSNLLQPLSNLLTQPNQNQQQTQQQQPNQNQQQTQQQQPNQNQQQQPNQNQQQTQQQPNQNQQQPNQNQQQQPNQNQNLNQQQQQQNQNLNQQQQQTNQNLNQSEISRLLNNI